jgi:mRNA export factor
MATMSSSQDIICPGDAQDTVSAVRFMPHEPVLAAASWDGKVYIYNAGSHGHVQFIGGIESYERQPFMTCDFSQVSVF